MKRLNDDLFGAAVRLIVDTRVLFASFFFAATFSALPINTVYMPLKAFSSEFHSCSPSALIWRIAKFALHRSVRVNA